MKKFRIISMFLWLSAILMAQEAGDVVMRYVSLNVGNSVKLTFEGAVIECRNTGPLLGIAVRSVPSPLDVEQNLTPEKNEAEKKWSYVLVQGKLPSSEWKYLPQGYSVEVKTPMGILRANEYLYWNAKERRLSLVAKENIMDRISEGGGEERDEEDYLPPPVKFTGAVIVGDKGLEIEVGEGGGTLQLPSSKEIWFHHSSLETGVQFISKTPYLMPEDIATQLDLLKGQPEEVREVQPGQS